MRYRHAIALETGQQQQNIFLVRALLDFETDILWQLHRLLLTKHVVLDLTSPYSGSTRGYTLRDVCGCANRTSKARPVGVDATIAEPRTETEEKACSSERAKEAVRR